MAIMSVNHTTTTVIILCTDSVHYVVVVVALGQYTAGSNSYCHHTDTQTEWYQEEVVGREWKLTHY